MRKIVFCLPFFLIACASMTDSRRPIVDLAGVDRIEYEEDLVECQQYAAEVAVGERVAKGAGRGAGVGAVAGAITGRSGRVITERAVQGAVAGGTYGGVEAGAEKRGVVRRCLQGRGYKVLN